MVKKLFFGLLVLIVLSVAVSAETQIAYDGFESGDWNGGSGWISGWYHQGDSAIVSDDSPYAGNYHMRMRKRNSYVDRPADLSQYEQVTLRFYAKVNSFESSDFANLMVSSDGINWHILRTFTPDDSDNQYHLYEFDLTPYGLTNNVWFSVDGEMSATNDYLYFDDVSFVTEDVFEPPYNWTGNVPSWHIQFNPTPESPAADVQYWNLDLFDVPNYTMQELKSQGVFVMCYFSAGSWEDWRPDADEFPQECLGNNNGWPGEKWLDTRCPEVRQIMVDRMDLGIEKGCEGFDPDNMDAYGNNPGFPLTEEDAIDYYNFLADYAHNQSKKIGLKNALLIIPDVLGNLDWEVNEQCYQYNECNLLLPVLNAGKPVFHI
ncbi:MAG: endo alpha-1,4 polygalactosaminidase [archaeon]